MNKILVIGMPRCGAHSLGQYLTKKHPDKTVITDEYTFLSDATIRECNIDKALAESEVYIILRKDITKWEESFEAIMGKPPLESMWEFVIRIGKFCDPIILYLESMQELKDFPHLNKKNYSTHPKKRRELNTTAYIHINRKNYD